MEIENLGKRTSEDASLSLKDDEVIEITPASPKRLPTQANNNNASASDAMSTLSPMPQENHASSPLTPTPGSKTQVHESGGRRPSNSGSQQNQRYLRIHSTRPFLLKRHVASIIHCLSLVS